MDKRGNLTSVDTYDSDFSVEEIEELTKEHFEQMKKLMEAPEGYREIKNVSNVFVSDVDIVITGYPEEDDESHNCDEMGCSSVSHVLFRAYIK
jgi:hypothetical protein